MNGSLNKFIFANNRILHIFVMNKDFQSINLAVSSFIRNIEEMICPCCLTDKEKEADIIIKIKPLKYIEEYRYEITHNRIIFEGNDDLGVIFGLYDFLETKLGVPPFYLIEGLSLIKYDSFSLDTGVFSSHPTSRFRGWFINDEDLIGSFKSIHKRDVPDYPFYHDVINPQVMDMIAETALRNKMNLIIPSTLINIMAPAERELVSICSNRGLYVSQHHIEPLGVSKYGFKQFAKENNLNDEYSYLTNKETFFKCYEAYVKEWSQFPRVIFQIGLRGEGDRPFWNKETKQSTDVERGKIISSAINNQVNLIRKYYPYEINMTSTLWMEGADLLKKGVLDIPKNIIIVFADVGMSQLFGDDFFEVKRDPLIKYGIYYHAAYCHTGPHLAEGVIPKKMEYSYKLAKEKDSLHYSIINACNVKELTFSLFLNAKLAWDNNLTANRIIDDYVSLFTQSKKGKLIFIKAIRSYFNSFKDIGETYYKDFCAKYNFSYHDYGKLPFPIVSYNDGIFKSYIYNFYYEQRENIRKPSNRIVCTKGKIQIEKALNIFNDVTRFIPKEYKKGFKSHWVFESLYFLSLFKSSIYFLDACEEGKNNNFTKCKNLYQLSSNELNSILKNRKKYFIGEFSSWYDGDHKIDIEFLIRRILEDYHRILEIKNIKLF